MYCAMSEINRVTALLNSNFSSLSLEEKYSNEDLGKERAIFTFLPFSTPPPHQVKERVCLWCQDQEILAAKYSVNYKYRRSSCMGSVM